MAKEAFDLVIGLGVSGQSVVRYLSAQRMPVRALDTRAAPPSLAHWRDQYPRVPLHLGSLREDWLEQASRLIVSPGVALATPAIARHAAAGKEVIGDIELFARAANAPIAAITGSNAKSTVTTLLGEMARAAGVSMGVGGNLGTPALDLLLDAPSLYALELSSFQLETTYSLNAQVAVILNISEDHMDRYRTLADYIAAKQRVYDGCDLAVWNRDDDATRPQRSVRRQLSFGFHPQADYRIDLDAGVLRVRGEPVLELASLALRGHHNALNVAAALALAEGLGLDLAAAISAARLFRGLPHRCELVAEQGGVQWFNDSKGTNVGATLAALNGIGPALDGKVILIAGGQGKGQDFAPLAAVAERHVRHALLLGEDRVQVAAGLGAVSHSEVADMAAAVRAAAALAQPGDAVLLSPACASFDLYPGGYVARGEDFVRQVQEVLHAR